MTAHRHRWELGPVTAESTLMVFYCADCGMPRPIRSRVVGGRLICLDCKRPLIGWRTDFAGNWSGWHLCPS